MPASQPTLTFESFGLTTDVFSDDPSVLERIRPALPPGWRERAGEPASARFGVMSDGRVIADGVEVTDGDDDPLVTLERELRHHVALHAPDHVFIHAGVVAVGDRAIVIPGRSFAGKTTLVAQLVDEGAIYYSDEYAAVDAVGRIHPFPKPLSVRAAGSWRGTPRRVSPERTGLRPVRAGLTVVTWYQPGTEWSPRLATPPEGALALLANTVPARSRPEQSLAAACALATDGPTVIGARGEVTAVTTALRHLAENGGGSPPSSNRNR